MTTNRPPSTAARPLRRLKPTSTPRPSSARFAAIFSQWEESERSAPSGHKRPLQVQGPAP
jgi:hypothetical protein